jgi:hypothetical protein
MRRLSLALGASLMYAVWTAMPAEAALCPPGCGDSGGAVTCHVCDTKKPKPGKPPHPGKPSLPACPPSKEAIPDDGSPHSADWVRVRCMEGGLVLLFWVPASVNPRQLALSLLDEMELVPVDVGITPKGVDPVALVGLPVWMWVVAPSAHTWGPNTISAGGVRMSARVEKVVWDMGDDSTVSCGKGSEWRVGDGDSESPTCGHTYQEQGEYTVQATTHWVATWSGYGQSGTFRFELTGSHRLQVGELQVIVTRR